MKSGCKICWVVSLVLLLALGTLSYVFVVGGNTEPHADGRTVVLLTADERNKVLAEMRGLLETVQKVIDASLDGDMDAVATASTAAGMVAAEGESAALIGKLPLDFLSLGMGTHKAFDELAQTAAGIDDPMVVLGELSGIMTNCVACHSGYRLGIEGDDREN